MRDRYLVTLEGEYVAVADLADEEIDACLDLLPSMSSLTPEVTEDDMRERLLIEQLIRRKGWRFG